MLTLFCDCGKIYKKEKKDLKFDFSAFFFVLIFLSKLKIKSSENLEKSPEKRYNKVLGKCRNRSKQNKR